jgi:hypothetical protein
MFEASGFFVSNRSTIPLTSALDHTARYFLIFFHDLHLLKKTHTYATSGFSSCT